MPEYLAPGVYVEEISTGPKPIEGVSTSNTGFLGVTERGPEYIKLITSWIEYQRWFGRYRTHAADGSTVSAASYLPYAVQGFFDNGGKRCFVGRITGDGATFGSGLAGNLFASAIGRGVWGNKILIRVSPASKADDQPTWFRVRVLYYRDMPEPFVDPTDPANQFNPDRVDPEILEDFDNLTHENKSNGVVKVINSASRLIRVWWGNGLDPAPIPPTPLTLLSGLGNAAVEPNVANAGDFNGQSGPIFNAPDEELGRDNGFVGLANVDEISLIAIPDAVRDGMGPITTAAINQCEDLRDRFAIVSVGQGQSQITPDLRPQRDTTYAGLYYPWIRVYDPEDDDFKLIPPTGHVAGIFARTDIERGVHKAPANEVVRGANNMEFPVTKGMQDLLNPRGVNCIRDFRPDGRGIRLWGARTMSSDPEWTYVNVRRLFMFVEESIDEGTQWVVFEPNHEPTWARVVRSVTNFLIRVWKSGALQGVTQDEAFFVKCDRTTMTQDDIDTGKLICYIGIAPVKPAEFVIFRISQKTIEAQG